MLVCGDAEGRPGHAALLGTSFHGRGGAAGFGTRRRLLDRCAPVSADRDPGSAFKTLITRNLAFCRVSAYEGLCDFS